MIVTGASLKYIIGLRGIIINVFASIKQQIGSFASDDSYTYIHVFLSRNFIVLKSVSVHLCLLYSVSVN